LKKLKNIFLRFSVILLVILLLSLCTGLIVIFKYGDDLKDYVLKNLNKELAIRVEIGEADISFIKTFPFVSIIMRDVVAYSNKELNRIEFTEINSDTLFRAEDIYVQFNIIDIIHKKYIIKRVLAINGKLNILTDNKGLTNYTLFRKTGDRKDTGQILELESFKLKNFNFLMINNYKNIEISGIIKEILFKGKFGRKGLTFLTGGTLFLEKFTHDDILFAKNMNMSAKVHFFANDSIYTIEKGILGINDLRFETSGVITSGDIVISDIFAEGKDLNLKSVISILPDYLTKWKDEYIVDGKGDITLTLQGVFSSTENPLINSNFTLNQGSISSFKWGIFPCNISFSGSYTNGFNKNAGTSIFNFNDLSFTINESLFKGSLKVENLISPQITSYIKAILKANDINTIINKTIFMPDYGIIEPEIKINTKLNSFREFDVYDIFIKNASGEIILKDLAFQVNKEFPEIQQLNGILLFINDSWKSDIQFISGKSDFLFKGQVDHVIKRFTRKTGSLWIQGEIFSRYSDLSCFINKQNSPETDDQFSLPSNLYFKLKFHVDTLDLNKFRATSISTDMIYKPGFLSFSSLHLVTMKGILEGYGGLIQDTGGNLLLKTHSQLEKIDIKEMFEVFNNFRQNFIISENLGGLISGAVDFSANLNSELEPEMKSVYAESKVIIENGELKDFAALQSLSKFVELSELEHVKFETLRNTILIKEQKVFVPEMAINSSAFNIIASGTHGFDNNFDYKIKINLSEILAKKARSKKENDEFAVLEKEGERINLFLSIYGTPDNFKIKYDRKEAVQQFKEDIQTEKKELKTILYEEFGLFKKQFSDTVKKEEVKESSPQFIFDWDNDEKVHETTNDRKREKLSQKKKEEFKIKWD